jgi:L-alanine-DL-glutamate epimerase-like enolase superfamily enzyme
VAAPVAILHTHVHSMRIASGAEALAARVLVKDATGKVIEGFGFTLNEDAGLARDMAAWDALGKSKGVALYGLLGGSYKRRIPVLKDELPAVRPGWDALRKEILDNKHDILRVDPFAWGSLEQVVTIAASAAAFDLGVALLAPNAHPWEIQYCAALACTFRGDDVRVIVRKAPDKKEIEIQEQPGISINWSAEPEFQKIQWQS